MSNPSNLIVPTSEQASENGRKGGIASGEARRAKKNMKQMAKMLMEMPVVGETNKQNLKNFGVQSEDQNYNTAIVVRLMQKALLEGDTGAIRLLGELTGDFGGAVGAGDDTVFEVEYPPICIPDNGRDKRTEKTLSPQAGPQTAFMASKADIVIYGGAAGGGKTYALLLEGLRNRNVKGWGGVIFRHNYNQITAEGGLWDASHKIYDLVPDAVPGKTPKLHWTFGGGGRLNFAHISCDDDLSSWQGTEICYLGFDELTHFSRKQFLYMLSRNRTTCGIRPYVRATCNPDADSWVADFISWWIDQETGYPIPERSGLVRYMNDEQKSSVANAIAGTGAQKGLLAILNASETDYNKLANAIDNAAGASERMADTQLDNLSGSITLLQSAVDGVKISFGKRLNPYVRSIADGLTASMPQIESALNDFMDFVDRKYDRLQAKVKAMTATEEWQNADFGGKVSIAWNEIVADPFKEWWETTGKSILSDIASDIGSGIGSGLSAGLMMLLGIDVSDSVNEGASVGKAFATGFAEGFDFDTIKEHLFSGLGNLVSSAGKLLPGGKSADLGSVVSAAIIAKAAMPVMSVGGDVLKVGKSVFGAQESLGGASLAGTILGSANAGTGLMGLGANAAIGLGAGNLSATASLGAGALGALGLGAIAGGATGGVSAISGIIDLYKAQRSNDEEYQKAYTSAGAAKLTGVAGGAAAGAMIGSIVPGVGTAVGGLIGAGLGGIAGFAESKRIKKEYEESAKASTLVTEKMQKVYDLTGYSVENVNFKTQALTDAMNDADVSAEQFGSMLQNAVSNDIVEHFGDLHLSLEEIKEAASTIVFDGMEGKFDSYTAQAQKAQSTLTSLKAAVSDLDKENWKMSLGMTVTEADIKEYRSSVSTMVSSTADYLQNKHYEANLALKLIMGDAADTTMLDSTYASFRNQLDDLSDKLSTAIDANIKLNGGVLKLDGDSEILSLQQQIQDITSQVSTAEENAKFDAIKIKYGGAALDAESFTSMQEELKNAVSSMTSQYDDALEVSLTNLRLQLDTGAIDQDEFYRQVQTLTDGYHAQISDLQVRVESFQLDSIAEAYSDALDGILPNLKGTTSEKLQQAMDAALKDNPNVAEWTNSDVVEWFDLNGMDAETQAAVIDLLKSVADSMPASFADSIRGSGLGDAARDATSDELDAISDTPFEKDAYVNVKPHVTVSSTYSASSGLFSSSPAASSSYSYTSPVTGKTVTPYVAGNHSMSIGGHASGGMVNGRELSWVGEEGPEMIIPLVPGRRERAVELYQQAGEILGITAHANGGLVGAGSTGSLTSYNALSSETLNYLTQSVNDAPIDSHVLSEDYSSSINNSNAQSNTQQTTVQPNVTVKVEASPEFNISGGGQSDDEIVAVIRRHMGDVTDELCGKIASKLEEVFANMPLKGVGV